MANTGIVFFTYLESKYLAFNKINTYFIDIYSSILAFLAKNANVNRSLLEEGLILPVGYSTQTQKEIVLNPFGSYLAGLFEGDGHIWIPSKILMKKHNPRFCITFHKNDLPLAEIILKKIGSGFIRIKSKENAVVLTVSPVKGLVYIISEIKNYLRTPKIHQVNKLIIWLNLHHKTNLIELDINKNSLDSDYWLSGFIDADAGFMINYKKKEGITKNIDVISLTITLEQRMVDPVTQESYEPVLKKIAIFFNTSLRIRYQKSTGNTYFRVVGSSILSRLNVIEYLSSYPLQSSKRLNYLDWKKASDLKISNKFLSDEDKKTIFDLKNNMNRKRVFFSWDHLTNSKLFIH